MVNHSKEPNAVYAMFDHPRFGKIGSIKLINDVIAGQEVFCDYGYMENYDGLKEVLQSLYKLGHWFSNKPEDVYKKEIQHHIQFFSNTVKQYKPVINVVASAFGLKTEL